MKHLIVGLGLLLLQIFLTLKGGSIFGKFVNPLLLFTVSIAIPFYLIRLCLRYPSHPGMKERMQPQGHIYWAIGGLITIALAYEELRKVFVQYIDVEKWSDVIPQVRILYERFSKGEFPYTPIEFPYYALQPIYMPLHWLPGGLAIPLDLDIRLIGYGFLTIAAGVYGWFLASQTVNKGLRILALVLPSLPLWGFIIWGPIDLSVTYEIVIGAYYLILAAGLLSRRLWLIVLGIVLCLLSRYTLLFWLPLFAILLLIEQGWKKSILVWGIVVTSFILMYIIPFYSKDPTMLSRGLTYYMGATVSDWTGYGDPPISWTHEYGISFAPLMKATFPGDMANRVSIARILQAIMLILTLATGIWAYRRWRHRIDMYIFSLIALYVFMTIYYFFAPLTFRYYLFPFLIVSAVLCGKIVSFSQRVTERSDT